MSSKNTVLQNLLTYLKQIDGATHDIPGCPFSPYTYKNNVFNNVTEEFKYLENINDFPTVTVFPTTPEQRIERGTGEVYGAVSYILRCYFMNSENNDQSDDFIEDLQFALNSFKYTQSNGDLVDLRILAVSSDEQMLDPYGITEVSFVLVYRLTI